VDLVYLDPPFNSNASYNVLFKAPDGAQSAAQIEAFDDTWHWNDSAETAFSEVLRSGNGAAAEMLRAMRGFLGENDMMAYLAMMAVRLIELHRVLKPTGSLYLHCDPTASHYLKILLDAVFGAVNIWNEIVWQRMTGKSLMKRRLPTNHDILLVYQKTDAATWNDSAIYVPYDLDNLPSKTRAKYSHKDADGRLYQLDNLINPNANRPRLQTHYFSKPEQDGCCQGDGGEEGLRTSVVAGSDAAPVLEPAEHDLDAVAPFVAALVVVDGLAARLPAWDAGLYPLVFQRFPEPVGIVAPICDQPFGTGQAAQQGGGSRVVADLACGHEELQGPSLGIGHGMQLGVQATLRTPDQTSTLIAGPPFFARRLEAVRCAFRYPRRGARTDGASPPRHRS